MVDIPLIAVKNATFHFNYKITQTTKEETTPSNSPLSINNSTRASNNLIVGKSIKALPIAKPAKIVGKFEKKSSSSQANETGGLDVTIELEKAEMPVGLERILEMLENAAMESQAEEPTDDGSADTNNGGSNADSE